MEEYIHSFYRKSSHPINESEIRRLSALFVHEKGIENFRIDPEGIYLEFNKYTLNLKQIDEIPDKNGFRKTLNKKPGFLMKQIRHLSESNIKTYGNRKPDCSG